MNKFNTTPFKVAGLLLVCGLVGPLSTFAAGPAAVNLASAGNFSVLTKAGISTTGSTVVVGDLGVGPIDSTAITGFALNLTAGSPFSTSPLVTGKIYAPDYANPTPAMVSAAVSDMQTAYTDAAGRSNPTATELGAGNIGGLTMTPGLYKWGTGVTIPTDVTLSGGANDVWIFQIAQTLTVSSGAKIILSGGAKASNIFWVVAGQTTLGTKAVFNGTILDKTAIVLNTGTTLNGRALAQTAVTLDASTVTIPSGGSSVSTPVPTPNKPTSTTTTTTTNTNATSSHQSSGGLSSQSHVTTATAQNSGGSSTVHTNSPVVVASSNPTASTFTLPISNEVRLKLISLMQQVLVLLNKELAIVRLQK